MIKLNRHKAVLFKGKNKDDDYVHLSAAKRVSFIWDLTSEVWSLKDRESVKRRLQRHITKLIKPKNKQLTGLFKNKLDVKQLKKIKDK